MSFERGANPVDAMGRQLSARRCALWALFATAIEIALSFAVAQAYPAAAVREFAYRRFAPPNAYERLCAADCLWYTAITQQGYHSSIPPAQIQEGESNVAFFPAFPLLVRATHSAASILPFSISWPAAALLASQMAAAGFWFVLLRFLVRWTTSPAVAAFAALALFCHPAAHFLVEGHSESLYLLAMAGVLWCGEAAPALGAIPGLLVGATRVLGFSFALYPAMRALRAQARERLAWAAATAGVVAGGVAFFVYCQMRFGVWDLYFQTQHLGWGHVADYGFLFRWSSYRVSLPFRKPVVVTVATLAVLALMEWRAGIADRDRKRTWTRRAMLATAAAQFYLTGAAGARTERVTPPFLSFSRYTLPIGLLVVVIASGQIRALRPPARITRYAAWAVGCGCLVSLVFLDVLRDLPTYFSRR